MDGRKLPLPRNGFQNRTDPARRKFKAEEEPNLSEGLSDSSISFLPQTVQKPR
ncbi:hypothetical protein DFE_2737 [Desulfovibrio ferrophilus]|uniref:Uncharacterized protein n=1 Tax=Desulfovibrio ferrophilus TaxID=241368 RepID=A0A2Z6B1Y1_9BACT|nr:hypothetical protein DFE_2737 [Desulfovibrio ferrophilus]